MPFPILMVKSVVRGNLGHWLAMRHHYMWLMTNLQQAREQYCLIGVFSHGKSLCAGFHHLYKDQLY